MEILREALYFWNDWIIGAAALCIGIYFWFHTRRPSALVVAIGTVFMVLSTVMGAIFASSPAGEPMSYFYGGASQAVGLIGAGLLMIGGIWYLVHDRKAARTRVLRLKTQNPAAPLLLNSGAEPIEIAAAYRKS